MNSAATPLLRQLVTPGPTLRPDTELLRAFASGGCPASFAEIVRRHGPLVWGACRRALGEGPDAEDAFQATFLVLARRAGSQRRPERLAGWLFGTALRTARRAARAARRRRHHESASAGPPAPRPADPLDELTARELLAALDEQLGRLPDKYRLPLLLVHWQGLTQAEAARRLGCSEGALKGRLERGRKRLADRLARRGFAAPALLLAPLAAAAVPAALHARTTALLDPKAAVPAAVAALAQGSGMAHALKAATAAATLVIAALVATSMARVSPAPADPPRAQPAPAQMRAPADDLPPGAAARVGTTWLRGRGHVTTVAFSNDGKRLAWAHEGWVQICEAATGKPIWEFKPHPGSLNMISEVAFSPDGRLLAAGSFWEKEVSVFDLETRRRLYAVPNTAEDQMRWVRQWQGAGFAFTPDGKVLAVGGKDGSFLLFDVTSGQKQLALAVTKEPAVNLMLTADGRTALTAHRGGELHLWDVTGQKHLRKLDAKAKSPQFTAISPDGKVIALVADHAVIELCEAGGAPLHRLTTKRHAVGMGFTPDGTSLRLALADGTVTDWDVRSGQERRTLVTCEGFPTLKTPDRYGQEVMAWFRPDGRLMAWVHRLNVRPFDLSTGKEAPQLLEMRDGVVSAFFSADGKRLILRGGQGEIGVWDWATGRRRGEILQLRQGDFNELVRSIDRRKFVFTTTPDDTKGDPQDEGARIATWEPDGSSKPAPLSGQVRPAWYATFSPDNRFLLASEKSHQVRVYDAATGRSLRTFPVANSGHPLVFSPDGSLLAVRTPGTTLSLHDFATGRLVHEIDVQSNVASLAFSPVEPLLATGHVQGGPGGFGPGGKPVQSSDHIVLWDAVQGREVRRFPTGHGTVYGLAFSPDGRLIASGTYGGTVLLWEAGSGQLRRKYEGHRGWVMGVDFAPDGKHLASASLDGTALVWRVFDPPAGRVDLDAAWADLARDGEAAHAAVAGFLAAEGAVPFLAARVKPAVAPPADEVKQWLADLADPQFARREAAEKKLARAGELVAAALRQAQENAPSAEARRRLAALLEKIDRPETRPEQLRELRAVEALERLATLNARRKLDELAKGTPDALLTRAAQAALKRLAKAPAN